MPEITGPETYSGPIQLLVFGQFKAGKTSGAATFPRPNIIDFDKGINVVKSKWWQEANPGHPVLYETFVEKTKDGRGVIVTPNAFDDACKYFDHWMQPVNRGKFDTWIIDSGTSLSEVAANKAIYLMGGKMPGIKSETHKNALAHGLVVPKMQDYGAERSMVEQFVEMVLSSQKNVVLLCHEKEVTKDDGTLEAIVPLLTGQSVQRIPVKFDEVYRLRTRPDGPKVKRSLQTQPDALTKVGSRLGVPDGTEWSWSALTAALGMEKK